MNFKFYNTINHNKCKLLMALIVEINFNYNITLQIPVIVLFFGSFLYKFTCPKAIKFLSKARTIRIKSHKAIYNYATEIISNRHL